MPTDAPSYSVPVRAIPAVPAAVPVAEKVLFPLQTFVPADVMFAVLSKVVALAPTKLMPTA